MKKEKIIVTEVSDNVNLSDVNLVKKMSFEGVDTVHDALFFAFHPEEFDKEAGLDDRFCGFWTVFLSSVGWNEEDFWDEYKARQQKCPDCGHEIDHDEDDEINELKLPIKAEVKSKAN